MQNIINALLNCLLVSIPEETIWIILVLILWKRFDLLDYSRWKYNVKQILIPLLPTVVVINFFRYIYIIPRPLMTLIGIITIGYLLIYMLKKNNFLNEKYIIIKTILFTFLSLIIIMIAESIAFPLMIHFSKLSLFELNNEVIKQSIMLLPTRLLEIFTIGIIVYFQNLKTISKLLLNIVKNKFLLMTLTTFSGVLIFYIVFMVKLIGENRLFENLSNATQVIASICLLIVPGILIIILLSIIIYFISQLQSIQKSHQAMFDDDI